MNCHVPSPPDHDRDPVCDPDIPNFGCEVRVVAIPTGWKDDGTYLTAPNGRRVVLGFRWHILTHTWSADDWPIESEHYESVLDPTNPQHGDGIVQPFRRRILAWKEDSSQVLVLWSGLVGS